MVDWIIIHGNPVDGFQVSGTFVDAGEAAEWASSELSNETWWVSSMNQVN